MTSELVGVAFSALVGIVGTWVKLNNDLTRIKSRLDQVEKNEKQVSTKLDLLMDMVTEIKVLLAKNRVE